MLLHIDSGYFCAGAVFVNDVCVEAAPIVKWVVGWIKSDFLRYAKNKGWKIISKAI